MADIASFFSTVIFLISSALLYPTLILLVTGFLFAILMAGMFCAEWLERARLKPGPVEDLPLRLQSDSLPPGLPHRVKAYLTRLRGLLGQAIQPEFQVENLLQDTTLAMWKSMDGLRILVRLGPTLGLMGTLIPMGTGLAALGQGDMTRLSADLVIAFTTTVVGLAIGLVAYCIYTIRRRWIEEDIRIIELATEILTQERPTA